MVYHFHLAFEIVRWSECLKHMLTGCSTACRHQVRGLPVQRAESSYKSDKNYKQSARCLPSRGIDGYYRCTFPHKVCTGNTLHSRPVTDFLAARISQRSLNLRMKFFKISRRHNGPHTHTHAGPAVGPHKTRQRCIQRVSKIHRVSLQTRLTNDSDALSQIAS
jgi:hypothetical protein